MSENSKLTNSGIEVKKVYTEKDLPKDISELPGQFPYTRGV
ncbi:MAG TPA: methylmalonyl-CoA mutase family protein, partial [Chitinophagaceae bacterium]|nr:methylmalonyl-CoA mutase family protein [Chitinophagaceae bacterium]